MIVMKELMEKIRVYNQTLSQLTGLEKAFVKLTEQNDYIWGFHFQNVMIPDTLEQLLRQQKNFCGLLPGTYEKLCEYLKYIQEFTCNTEIVRMDVRSSKLSNYQNRVFQSIGAFYIFYGAGLSMRSLIYGEYEERFQYLNFAPVIAIELLQKNEEVIGYCREILLSENNTGFLTRNVIIAIEQSKNQELQNLMTNLLVAAKLQEGLRQSILETSDEYQFEYFCRILDVIGEENLLRYSSVQRSVLTWVGIGYEQVERRLIQSIFETIHLFFHDENARREALLEKNPLKIYLALYCLGARSLEKAIEEAVSLLEQKESQILAAVLIYLKMTRNFPIMEYQDLLETYRENEWITALYLSELNQSQVEEMLLSKEECIGLFDRIFPFVSKMKSRQVYSSKGFEWFSIILHKETLIYFLSQLLIKTPERERIERLLPYLSFLWKKAQEEFLIHCFPKVSLSAKKEFLIREIISQQQFLCEFSMKQLAELELTEKDILALEGRLKTKKAYARAAIVQVLAKQSEVCIKGSFERLSSSQEKLIRESAFELQRLAPNCFDEKETQKPEILGKEQGYGLYQRGQKIELPMRSFLKIQKKGFFKKKEVVDLQFLKGWKKEQVISYLTQWDERIEVHRKDSYRRFGEECLVGDRTFYPLDYRKRSLDALPLGEVWRKYFEKDHLSDQIIFQLYFIINSLGYLYQNIFSPEISLVYITAEDTKQWKYYNHISRIITYYFYECDQGSRFIESAAGVLELFLKYAQAKTYRTVTCQGQEIIHSIAELTPFLVMMGELHLEEVDDETFREYFPLVYHCYLRFHLDCEPIVKNKLNLQPIVVARACSLGILPKSILMEMLLDKHSEEMAVSNYYFRDDMLIEAFRAAYFENKGVYGKPHFELPKENREACQYLRETLDEISDALIRMETGRLNDVTCNTKIVTNLLVIRGVKYLLIALKMLEGEDIKRTSFTYDRQEVFANIIRHCYPLPSDSADALQLAEISEKRLVEVAMMAPQWIQFVSEVLKWDGFSEACFYFIAHMKQSDPEQKKAMIAHYTELDPIDLNDGAFDIEWCRSICQKLGEKRIQVLYNASKLLCENSFHIRARKYMDACTGKIKKEEFWRQAIEKRNKDALNAYCIAPLENEKDLLERYLYVQQFLKESKTFGAQRQASEKRCCEIAMMNLARNAKFNSVDRLIWNMESKIVDTYRDVLSPKMIEDVEIWIEVDELGRNDIRVRKGGKKLKSIPARLKNNEDVKRIKEVNQLFHQQYQRTREMLERAMVERTEYDCSEIEAMANHIIVGPLIRHLVMISRDVVGFYDHDSLVFGEKREAYGGKIRIAHAFDLYQKHVWQEFQQYLYVNQIVQPFKQVFRELYLKLEEELEHTYTKRYTGYQIQTSQAAAVLKKHGWNVSYEYGLEKVCHKEDTVVHLAADADWFSPSDIEAPSIDYVEFSHRTLNEPLTIAEVDDVLFSEMMRDVDLAVSLAFIGGVDPITSTSTFELRKSIITCTCQLMKLSNVQIDGHFAHITGKYNEYSVHLGSGVVHQKAAGMIHIVPVWSGNRGKVYLPFLDEDPLTAQIVSKIVMLSEDAKIKDPEILGQIYKQNSKDDKII